MDAAPDLCMDGSFTQAPRSRYCGVGVAEAMPGAKLTELVCKYMRKLFAVHRKLLNGDQEYKGRTRDPPLVNLAGAPDEELELK